MAKKVRSLLRNSYLFHALSLLFLVVSIALFWLHRNDFWNCFIYLFIYLFLEFLVECWSSATHSMPSRVQIIFKIVILVEISKGIHEMRKKIEYCSSLPHPQIERYPQIQGNKSYLYDIEVYLRRSYLLILSLFMYFQYSCFFSFQTISWLAVKYGTPVGTNSFGTLLIIFLSPPDEPKSIILLTISFMG